MEAEKTATNHNDKILSQRQKLSQKCSVIPCSELTPAAICLLDFLLLFLLLKQRVVAQVFQAHVLRRGKNDHPVIP